MVKKFPEVITGGDTIKEVKKMVKEAIEFCIECRENEYYSWLIVDHFETGQDITKRFPENVG